MPISVALPDMTWSPFRARFSVIHYATLFRAEHQENGGHSRPICLTHFAWGRIERYTHTLYDGFVCTVFS